MDYPTNSIQHYPTASNTIQQFFKSPGYLFLFSGSMGNQTKNNNTMKFVKFGALALALGLFVASCGNDTASSTDTKTADSSSSMSAAPAAPAAPMADTTHAAMAADTSHMSGSTSTSNMAPAAGTDTGMKMKSSTTKTTTTTKKH